MADQENGKSLASDMCMALGPEGDVCRRATDHDGRHDWDLGPRRADRKVRLRAPSDEEFEGQEFLHTDSFDAVANELIASCAELSHLEGLNLAFLWKRKGGQTKGNATLGKCQKPSGLLAYYSKVDFVVWLAADHAVNFGMDDWQLEAALHHELMHADVTDDENTDTAKKVIRGHDVEEFSQTLKRYGLWKPDLHDFVNVARQLSLEEVETR